MSIPTTRGWTLIELIMAIVIVSTLAVFVGPVLLNAVKAYDRTQATVGTYAKMRFAMERMAREIGAMRRNPADTTAFQVASMAANNFTFTKEDGQEVGLTAAGTTVNLAYTGVGNGALTDRVTAFSFAYFRHDGATAAANAAQLEFVEINLTLSDGTNSYANRLRVALRNVQ